MSRATPPDRDGQGGAALIYALILTALLATLSVRIMSGAETEIFGTRAALYRIQARLIAQSGLLAAGKALQRDGAETQFDDALEPWTYFPDHPSSPGAWFFQGQLRARIRDETGKVPLNALHPDMKDREAMEGVFQRLLTMNPLALDQTRAKDLTLALNSWLSPAQKNAAGESPDMPYDRAGLPYRNKGSALDVVRELTMVAGFSDAIYQGRPGEQGLKDLVTVWSSGLININTAPLPVLAALAPGLEAKKAEDFARTLDAYRRNPENRSKLGNPGWVTEVAQAFGAEVPMGVITARSMYFSVEVEARSGSATCRGFAVFKRQLDQGNQQPIVVLYQELQ